MMSVGQVISGRTKEIIKMGAISESFGVNKPYEGHIDITSNPELTLHVELATL
jgi:hypothetical protein